jgi:PhzF family phenazine biosynthesis protein
MVTKQSIYQVDAFASELFSGNPAAVVPLESWIDDELMQSIAQENNLSETAFFVPSQDDDIDFEIRWMTPTAEVRLCGHATIAAAHVLYEHLDYDRDQIRFSSRSGPLSVERDDAGRIVLDFPEIEIVPCEATKDLIEGLGVEPVSVFHSYDKICVLESEQQIRDLQVDHRKLLQVPDVRSIAVTAPGDHCDFVARLFAPAVGIDEDPVTGSLYTMLGPYWSKVLGKQRMEAQQVSARKGHIQVQVPPEKPGRVLIAGHAVTYLTGQIYTQA